MKEIHERKKRRWKTNTGDQCSTVEFHGTFPLYEIDLPNCRFIIESKVFVTGLRCDILRNNILQKVFWPSSLIPQHPWNFFPWLQYVWKFISTAINIEIGMAQWINDVKDGRSSISGRCKRLSSAPQRPDRLKPISLLLMHIGSSSLWAKAKGARRWPFTSIYCLVKNGGTVLLLPHTSPWRDA